MEDLKKIQEFFSKPLEEGKQLDQADFNKVVKAVEQTGHPVTVLFVPKFNEIEVLTGMDAPDDMLRDLSNAVDSLGYGRNDIIIAGDSSNLSRREYSDIFRVNGGHQDYFEESVNENKPVAKETINTRHIEDHEYMAAKIQKAMNDLDRSSKDYESKLYRLQQARKANNKGDFKMAMKIMKPFLAPVNEMDMNDPILMKMRAAKDKLAKIRAANAGDDGNDKFFDNAKKLAFLKKERAQLMRDMEQEAEPEGGPIANEYGNKLNRIDAAIAKLSGRKEMTYDQAIAEGFKDYLGYSSVEVSRPTQDQVDRFFTLTQNETHYLNSKPVEGQEKTFNKMEVEPWDEYDLSNWNSLVRKAKAKGKSLDEATGSKVEVVLSNQILDFLQQRNLITGVNAQKVHKDLTAFIKNIKINTNANLNENNSYARVSMPSYVKDKKFPNFLYVNIEYDLGPGGSSIALGKETMTGQIRRESAAEAMRLAGDVARDLEAEYDLEDIDIVDKENGVVQVFAVSDDFINMDPNMLGESLNENLNPEVSNAVNRFIKAMAKRYDYSEQDAVYAIMAALKQRKFDGLNESQEEDEEEEVDYSNISSLEDELRRLRRWSSQYGSKGADSKIEYLEQRIEYLKSNPLTVAEKVIAQLKEAKPGLWANINAKQKRGEKPSHGNSDAFKSAVKAGKKINSLKEEEDTSKIEDEFVKMMTKVASQATSAINAQTPVKISPELEKKLDEGQLNEFIDPITIATLVIGAPGLLKLLKWISQAVGWLIGQNKDGDNKFSKAFEKAEHKLHKFYIKLIGKGIKKAYPVYNAYTQEEVDILANKIYLGILTAALVASGIAVAKAAHGVIAAAGEGIHAGVTASDIAAIAGELAAEA
jgi:hypothetical protein